MRSLTCGSSSSSSSAGGGVPPPVWVEAADCSILQGGRRCRPSAPPLTCWKSDASWRQLTALLLGAPPPLATTPPALQEEQLCVSCPADQYYLQTAVFFPAASSPGLNSCYDFMMILWLMILSSCFFFCSLVFPTLLVFLKWEFIRMHPNVIHHFLPSLFNLLAQVFILY